MLSRKRDATRKGRVQRQDGRALLFCASFLQNLAVVSNLKEQMHHFSTCGSVWVSVCLCVCMLTMHMWHLYYAYVNIFYAWGIMWVRYAYVSVRWVPMWCIFYMFYILLNIFLWGESVCNMYLGCVYIYMKVYIY